MGPCQAGGEMHYSGATMHQIGADAEEESRRGRRSHSVATNLRGSGRLAAKRRYKYGDGLPNYLALGTPSPYLWGSWLEFRLGDRQHETVEFFAQHDLTAQPGPAVVER